MGGIPVGFSRGKVAVLAVCVVLIAMSLVWAFLSMRAVMAVGGACADGGPYVSAQACPAGAGLIGVAVPVLVLSAIGGSVAAAAIPAPLLFAPMWGFLFGSLGWNFLDAARRTEGSTGGWIVCGVVFELMAAPALVVLVLSLAGRPTVMDAGSPPLGSGWWWLAYLVLGVAGVALGAASFYAVV